jgi:hypothetical protein
MNELTKQLAEQAKLLQSVNGMAHYRQQHKLEKFAELIVKECGEVAYNAYWNEPDKFGKGIHIKEKIKQHFGLQN